MKIDRQAYGENEETRNIIIIERGDEFFVDELIAIARACNASFTYRNRIYHTINPRKQRIESESRIYEIQKEIFCIHFKTRNDDHPFRYTLEELQELQDEW